MPSIETGERSREIRMKSDGRCGDEKHRLHHTAGTQKETANEQGSISR